MLTHLSSDSVPWTRRRSGLTNRPPSTIDAVPIAA
jgi:hypothetical protein